jgi:hypothetical protein
VGGLVVGSIWVGVILGWFLGVMLIEAAGAILVQEGKVYIGLKLGLSSCEGLRR